MTRQSRRAFLRRAVSLGLCEPLLAKAGTREGPLPTVAANRRNSGGQLRILSWQAPTLINPHFAVGLKDLAAAQIFYEPLATWDEEANLVPILADGVPSIENGGVSRDGLSVTWQLKRGVRWHDGRSFTADDCVFNWEYARDPTTTATTAGLYRSVNVVKIDSHTLRIEFEKPTPFWADAFVGQQGLVIPKHLFEPFKGANSQVAPNNLKAIGTGPYAFVDFRPGDLVRGRRNPHYHVRDRPYFDSIEMKGGGDAVSAARAVLQTAEFDFASNLQVEDEILQKLERRGSGRIVITQGGDTEFIMLNQSDPWSVVDGERSNPRSQHPVLSDPRVREAISLVIDRTSIQRHIYGRGGATTANLINNPKHFNSKNVSWEFNVEKANALLDHAGWKREEGGLRAKAGKKLKLVFQTSVNAPRQKTQAIVKQVCERVGIEVELKAVTPSVFFSSDIGNADTSSRFLADLQMYTGFRTSPDPGRFMEALCSWEMPSKANNWQGQNVPRWRSSEYDQTFKLADAELDPIKRVSHLIRLNDLVCKSHVLIPLVNRPKLSAAAKGLRASFSAWGGELWNLKDWYRTS